MAVGRGSEVSAVMPLDKIRRHFFRSVSPRTTIFREDGRVVALMEGRPFAAERSSLDEAISELIDALREYAVDWDDHYQHAPNHAQNWALVQLITFSTDGRILTTRISRPVTTRGDYARSLWAHILRDQLDVTADEFWDCMNHGVLPDRGAPQPSAALQAVPLHLVRELGRLGVPEDEVLGLDPAAAAALLAQRYLEAQQQNPTDPA